MSTAMAPKLMTVEEFLALPDDGVDRWLFRGQLREYPGSDTTRRDKLHSITEARITAQLGSWLSTQPEPRGEVVCGDAGFILRHDPDSTVGVDVAYVAAHIVSNQTDDTTLFDGAPVLAVEIQSPNNTVKEMTEKVQEYLASGVQVVWLIDPYFQTVIVHRPGVDPTFFSRSQTLTGDPELPGFACPVAHFFR